MVQFIQQRGSAGRPRFDFRQSRGPSDNPSDYHVTFLSDRSGNLWVIFFSKISGNDPVNFLSDISGNPPPVTFSNNSGNHPVTYKLKLGPFPTE